LVIEGPAEAVQDLSAEDVLVVAPVQDFAPSETQQYVTAKIILPPGLTLVGDLPQIKVDIRERPLAPPAGQ